MQTRSEKWINRCNPCRKCGNKPTVQRGGKTWVVHCYNCNPARLDLLRIDLYYHPLDAVRAWNDLNPIETRQEKIFRERQEILAQIDGLDIENIGAIDGATFAKKLKQYAESLSKIPSNKDYMQIATAIHMLYRIIEKMPQFEEDEHE